MAQVTLDELWELKMHDGFSAQHGDNNLRGYLHGEPIFLLTSELEREHLLFADAMAQVQSLLDDAPVPTKNRMVWNPFTNKLRRSKKERHGE